MKDTRMKVFRTGATAAVIVWYVAAASAMEPPGSPLAPPCVLYQLCVIDAQDRPIGMLLGTGARGNQDITTNYSVVVRQYFNEADIDTYYAFTVAPDGVSDTAKFLFSSANCEGTAYMVYENTLTVSAAFYGKVLYAPSGPRVTMTFQSHTLGDQCITAQYGPVSSGIAIRIDPVNPPLWVPPFTVKFGP